MNVQNSQNQKNNLLDTLNLVEEQIENIRPLAMYELYKAFIATPPAENVKTKEVGEIFLQRFKEDEKEAAVYVFESLEKELLSGESLPLLRDLALAAFVKFGTVDITIEQYDELCPIIGHYYIDRGLIED